MSAAYVVIFNDDQKMLCELYAGFKSALARVNTLNSSNFSADDLFKQEFEDGSVKWIVSLDNKYCAIYFNFIEVEPITDAVVYDDPYNDDLPAGWFATNHRPAFMKDLWNKPESLTNVFFYTKEQKFALAKARILKRPNYHLVIDSITYDHNMALIELTNKTVIGEQIAEDEANLLEIVREQRIQEFYK